MIQITPEAIRDAVNARRSQITDMLLELVGTSSITGSEGDAQRVIRRMLEQRGLEIDEFLASNEQIGDNLIHVGEQETYEDRPSIVGVRSGTGGGRSLLLNGHVDTVPVEDRTKWSTSPEGEVIDNRLYGLGSTDMKGGVIGAIAVLDILDDLGVELRGDLKINTVTGEEDGGLGTVSTIMRGHTADAVIVPEPTNLGVVIASGGSLVFRLTVPGVAAHGANRNAGVSAIENFIPIFQDLLAWEAERNASVHHPLYDHYENKFPISVGVVRSGDWPSTVPDRLIAEGRLGFIPGEDMFDMMRQTEARIAAASGIHPFLKDHPPTIEYFSGQFTAAEIAPDDDIVQAVARGLRCFGHDNVVPVGLTGGADTRHFVNLAGIPAMMFGPGIMSLAHHSDEYIDLDTLMEFVAILTGVVLDWCEPS